MLKLKSTIPEFCKKIFSDLRAKTFKSYILYLAVGLTLAAFLFIGCRQGEPPSDRTERGKPKSAEIVTVNCKAPVFENLTLEEKQLLYYLSSAAIAGDEIAYAQGHPEALQVKRFLDGVFKFSYGMKPPLLEAMKRYGREFYANHGFRNSATGEKIILGADLRMFNEALQVATSNGAKVGPVAHKDIWMELERLQPVLYDAELEIEAQKLPQLTELKAGNDSLPPGKFADKLTRIADNLRLAREFAGESQRKSLEKLAYCIEVGGKDNWDSYYQEWILQDYKINCLIDIGFIDGVYSAYVFIADPAMTKYYTQLADNLSQTIPEDWWILNKSALKKASGNIQASEIITVAGKPAFRIPESILIESGEELKMFIFNNAIEAYILSEIEQYRLFTFNDSDKNQLGKFGAEALRRSKAMNKIIALSLKINDDEKYPDSRLEEILDEIVIQGTTQYLLSYPEIGKGIMADSQGASSTAALCWLGQSLIDAVSTDEKFEFTEPETIARNVMINYLSDRKAVSLNLLDGHHYYAINDENSLRNGFKEILDAVQKIATDGNEAEFEKFLNHYNLPVASEIKAEIANRMADSGTAPSVYLLTPQLKQETTRMGKVKNVEREYPEGVIEQALYMKKVSSQ